MLKGDSNPYRYIGHTVMYDPYAALEDVSGAAFHIALERERTFWQAATKSVSPTTLKKYISTTRHYLNAAAPRRRDAAQEIIDTPEKIYIQHTYGHRLNVWIGASTQYYDLTFFSSDATHYLTIADTSDGGERLTLKVFRHGTARPRFCLENVGPTAALQDGYLYYTRAENVLRYPTICVADLRDAAPRTRILYYERDPRFQCEIVAPPRQRDVFLHTFNALDQRCGVLSPHGVRWIVAPRDSSLFPIDATTIATDTTLRVGTDTYALPAAHTHVIDAAVLDADKILVSTVHAAVPALYIFSRATRTYTKLWETQVPQNVMIHTYSTTPSVTITHPAQPNTVYEIADGKLVKARSNPQPLRLRFAHGSARSADGTQVPYTFVSARKNPRRLIVTGYGAYGISSDRSYPKHWLPALARGYALAVAAPRGGRDDGDPWYDAARTAPRKHKTFEDCAAVIAAVQKTHSISPHATIFYGRSAGGWVAAAIAMRYSHLVAAVYAEVPYLDVLRTTSNPRLPLTTLEYDEFGDPVHNPRDYAALRKISPVDTIMPAPAYAPFILLRTALHDAQVLPYESLKYAARARDAGWDIIVGVDKDGGHFAAADAMYTQQATDAAILDKIVGNAERPRRRRTQRKLRSQRSKSIKRRRTSSRKI